ncbi:hypothetical protein FSARC_1854 [Fusarium sarcochroum]|uniref:Tat pathway signal sequence n=1 Tax=Fusarium sarcochroum TaxID=1208366 RepID=A0A8H4XEK9_9HYPO|nr:hypothetical protein FSARC_1854 [Fusarium sarcochroum]
MAVLEHFSVKRLYSKLNNDEFEAQEREEIGADYAPPPRAKTQSAVLSITTLLCVIVSAIYSIVLLSIGYNIGLNQEHHQNASKIYDVDSPIFNLVRPTTKKLQYNNTFWPGSSPSVFRQPPSDEVDAAWERISNGRDIVISREEVIALGKNPNETVRADPAWGFGDDAHLGLVHAMHQNHCLNAIRKAVYYNYYYRNKRGFGANPPKDYRAKYYSHMDHCLDFLRQDIACKADLSISTYRWMEGEVTPEADFATWHQCRDFEGLLAWHAKHEINAGMTSKEQKNRWDGFVPKKGDVVIPQDPETNQSYWKVNEFEGE